MFSSIDITKPISKRAIIGVYNKVLFIIVKYL